MVSLLSVLTVTLCGLTCRFVSNRDSYKPVGMIKLWVKYDRENTNLVGLSPIIQFWATTSPPFLGTRGQVRSDSFLAVTEVN